MSRLRLLPLRLAAAIGIGSLACVGVVYAASLGLSSNKLFAWGQTLTKGTCNQTSTTADDTYVQQASPTSTAGATATTATLNVLTLYTLLQVRGWFHFTGKLAGRIGRQLVATAAMSAALWALMPLMASRYGGSVFERVWSLAVLVSAGLAVFFAVAWLVGALDKDLMAQLRRRPKAPAAG